MRTGSSSGPARRDDGFIMVVLLVGIAIGAVMMSAALPAWRQQVQRDREEDLIFYGEQYGRAIAMFYGKNNCTLPQDINVLVSQRLLRKKWKDPVTGKDFLPLLVGGAAGASSGTPQPQQQGGGGLSGVAGVNSTSTATSIKVYRNQQQHSAWQFNFQQFLQQMSIPANCNQGPGGGPGRGGQPGGQPGRGGQPAGPAGPGRGGQPAGPGRGADGRGGTPPPAPARGGRGLF